MLNKYIVTLETPEGLEVICRPRDGPFISSFVTQRQRAGRT